MESWPYQYCSPIVINRGAGAGPTGTAAVGPMLEAKFMNFIKSWLQKF